MSSDFASISAQMEKAHLSTFYRSILAYDYLKVSDRQTVGDGLTSVTCAPDPEQVTREHKGTLRLECRACRRSFGVLGLPFTVTLQDQYHCLRSVPGPLDG